MDAKRSKVVAGALCASPCVLRGKLSLCFLLRDRGASDEPRDHPAAAGCRESCIEETASMQNAEPIGAPERGLANMRANGPHWVDSGPSSAGARTGSKAPLPAVRGTA